MKPSGFDGVVQQAAMYELQDNPGFRVPQPGMSAPYQGMAPQYPLIPGQYPTIPMQPGYNQPYMAPQAPNVVYQMPGQPMTMATPMLAPQWMMRPQTIPGCPVGLEYLTQIDALFVNQQVELMEVITGFETNNKYSILNAYGQQVYFALEDSGTCMRLCCGPKRGFTINIVDNSQQLVMKISRAFKCCAGCCWCAGCCDCCSHEVRVESANGELLGYVEQAGSFWKPRFNILDTDKKKVLKIEGPCCIMNGPCCTCDTDFQLIATDGSCIGKISKKYAGFVREMATDADRFSINFPMDLSVSCKATLLACLFLIDFMFFESNQNNNK